MFYCNKCMNIHELVFLHFKNFIHFFIQWSCKRTFLTCANKQLHKQWSDTINVTLILYWEFMNIHKYTKNLYNSHKILMFKFVYKSLIYQYHVTINYSVWLLTQTFEHYNAFTYIWTIYYRYQINVRKTFINNLIKDSFLKLTLLKIS